MMDRSARHPWRRPLARSGLVLATVGLACCAWSCGAPGAAAPALPRALGATEHDPVSVRSPSGAARRVPASERAA